MKKYLLVFIAVFTVITLTACKEETPDDNNNEPYELTTERTDSLELLADYEDKSFLKDGIGEVDLAVCIDGDTARFTETGDDSFSVRFLGVDTPESTASIEEWGKAASDHTCDALQNAETIVLEWDQAAGTRTDTSGNRYLAFVWVDGRLLNLELIELAYSPSSAATLKYGEIMQNAWYAVQKSGRHIYGEVDPDFDYTIDGQNISIEELRANRELYVGRRIEIEGTITDVETDGFTLTQDEQSIFVYTGYSYYGQDIIVGNVIRVSEVVPTYYPQGQTGLNYLQVSDFSRHNVELLEEAQE